MLPDKKENILGTSVTKKILRLLEPLKRSESGASIFAYIEQTLCSAQDHSQEIEQTYAGLLMLLLDTLARQLPNGSPLQVQLKLLEVRLTPPFAATDLAELKAFLETHVDDIARGVRESDDVIELSLAPLLESFNIRDQKPEPAVAAPVIVDMIEEVIPDISPDHAERPTPPERRVDGSYRRHLDEKRQGIQRIQQALAHQVSACIKNNLSIGAMLEKELEILQQTNSQQDIMVVREQLIGETQALLTEHRTIANKLQEAQNFLGVIESDSQQLSDELTRIHLLSLTDDLTGLPNRRAFLRRLQDEVGRVQRYGNPLSLALIDLDGFKAVNDKLGHAAGDEVLRVVAAEILSIFRHHDLVARYGGEEFAVLLPNTHIEGALRALRKVQKRAQETNFQYDGSTIPLPTFSAGLTLYRPGESPEAIIQRADHALYRAKRLGRNRIEFDRAEAASNTSTSTA
ncbi:MAG: GGDEF domain-containing protein [Pseudomonadota bacterium]